ncbi:GNAT family N-acetyltransferase [Leisingera daeponensis]|uniref:GNAT family N-acetyltransferase n=1 Tax=Leisingera daeponensis TaxID=405746 RepID=A0ABS7NDG6_9RHOB|nr:GNAT family N-acetyltransferase [Leisingera daeponensis]MBY6056645.1 GNAT family N-acetyltransferase [Leisingera daeponensis]MBY6139205.1 GNAT family N-acetyltransferase [Leisingera daeponensis]
MKDVTLRRFAPSDMQWLVARHQDIYAREAGFDDSFGRLVADILHDFCAAHDPACERGWMAVSGTERLGTVFCMKKDDETAQLRLFLLTPKARGKGLGKRLLRDCMEFARAAGYREMMLKTHESHRTACALYQAFGWRLQDSRPVRNYGQDLVEQTWQLSFHEAEV